MTEVAMLASTTLPLVALMLMVPVPVPGPTTRPRLEVCGPGKACWTASVGLVVAGMISDRRASAAGGRAAPPSGVVAGGASVATAAAVNAWGYQI